VNIYLCNINSLPHVSPAYRTRLMKDRERDVSEKIALGLPNTGGGQQDQFDQRLFNQSKVHSCVGFSVLHSYLFVVNHYNNGLNMMFFSIRAGTYGTNHL